jgi:transcriptional regulator with XRE-family HTH domain
MDIGLFLKKLRLEKKYTLSYVASNIKSTASLLSQIENGKITPSLNSLEDLLKFYAVNLSDFFKQVEQKSFIFVGKKEKESIRDEEHGYELTLLASKLQNNALESYLVDLYADATIDVITINKEINGERIIYVISGKLKVILDNADSFIMTHGDSLNFKSYVSCKITSQFKDVSTFLISGVPPVFF